MSEDHDRADADSQQRQLPPIQIELKEQQFKPILEKLQERPRQDPWWRKALDLFEKLGIGLAGVLVAALSVHVGYQELVVKRSEFGAKNFAGLFAEKEEARLEAAASMSQI